MAFEHTVQKWLFVGISIFYFASLAGFFFIGWNLYNEDKAIAIPLAVGYVLLAVICVIGGYGAHKYWIS